MPKRKKPRRNKPPVGSRPGTLAIDPTGIEPRITALVYDPSSVKSFAVDKIQDLEALKDQPGTLWVDIQGLDNEATLWAIARVFSVHPLALEDIAHASVRPKVELYDNHVMIVTRMLHGQDAASPETENVTLLLGKNYVLTFQPKLGDVLDPVRQRLRTADSAMRRMEADYLAYAILDTIIDAYFPVIDRIGDHIEALEEQVLSASTPDTLRELTEIRSKLLSLRHAVVPQRESVNSLIRDENPFVGEKVRLYLRDTYDHIVQEAEALEVARELSGGLMNTYLSVVSNRLNDVMKTLTIVASIFVPLTFLAGIYGMNFRYMPELEVRWAYPALLLFMALSAGGMLFYFRRKGWF